MFDKLRGALRGMDRWGKMEFKKMQKIVKLKNYINLKIVNKNAS
jgi:hypothetical protein